MATAAPARSSTDTRESAFNAPDCDGKDCNHAPDVSTRTFLIRETVTYEVHVPVDEDPEAWFKRNPDATIIEVGEPDIVAAA